MLGVDDELLNDELSDWGSDFDDDIIEEEENSSTSAAVEQQYIISSNGSMSSGCSSTASANTKDENNSNSIGSSNSSNDDDLYEIPDGKPSVPIPTVVIPGWVKNNNSHNHSHHALLDENFKPIIAAKPKTKPKPTAKPKPKPLFLQSKSTELPSSESHPQLANHFVEHVLLPTRATKDEESKNFIESLKRKLSQKNLYHPASLKSNGSASDSSITKGNKNKSQGGSRKDAKQSNGQQVDPELIKKLGEAVQKFPWFYRVDRQKAELILENYNSDGSFLVRECQHGGPNVPFTLTIRFGQRFFHIQIRHRPEDFHFALGTMKINEMHFSTVQELIDTYRKLPLQLHTNGKYFGETKLTQPPIVYSFTK